MEWFQKARDAIANMGNNVAQAAQKVVPSSISTDQGVRDSLKLPSDGPSKTITGGRRRKTMHKRKKNRKTRSRKH
jgi:hypothetical protein